MYLIIRNLLIAVLVSCGFMADASHFIGGDVYYKYVGDQPGVSNPNTYDIYFVIYREQSGATLQNNLSNDINVADLRIVGMGCSYVLNLTNMVRVMPEFAAPNAYDCIAPNTGTSTPSPMVNIYKERVVLDPTRMCDRYRIELLGSARPNNYTNIVDGGYFYFAAELNRRLGENSSPEFLNSPLNYACSGSYQIYQQNAVEVNGDSVVYELVPARNTSTANVPYNAGFSYLNPISVNPSFPFDLDPNTGTLTYMSNATGLEVSTFAIVAREYRYDSLLGFWEDIGYTSREIQLVVKSTCRPIVNQGVKLDPMAPGTYIDPYGRQARDYNCLDTAVSLTFTLPVECFSVALDGTDFRLTAPNGQPIPIKRIIPYCDVNNEADSVKVVLYKPLIFNGEYYLYSKTGSDANTLLNKCGKALEEFDTIVLNVQNCLDPEFFLANVSVDEDRRNRVDIFVDTLTLPKKYIDFARFYRSDDSGSTFHVVGNLSDITQSFYDPTPGPTGVDRQYYYYRYDLIANGEVLTRIKPYHTIHLSGNITDIRNIPLNWSAYAGPNHPQWGNFEYKVQWGPANGSGGYNFVDVSDAVFPMPDSSYTLSLQSETPGNYAVRVLTEPTPSGHVSESNWLVYNVPTEIPPVPGAAKPVEIPNAFTPTGDGMNDRWTIKHIDTWELSRVSLFNRWGRVVWSTDRYSNQDAFEGKDNSGNDLPEGVYMYVIELSNGPTNQSEVHEGAVHLMR